MKTTADIVVKIEEETTSVSPPTPAPNKKTGAGDTQTFCVKAIRMKTNNPPAHQLHSLNIIRLLAYSGILLTAFLIWSEIPVVTMLAAIASSDKGSENAKMAPYVVEERGLISHYTYVNGKILKITRDATGSVVGSILYKNLDDLLNRGILNSKATKADQAVEALENEEVKADEDDYKITPKPIKLSSFNFNRFTQIKPVPVPLPVGGGDEDQVKQDSGNEAVLIPDAADDIQDASIWNEELNDSNKDQDDEDSSPIKLNAEGNINDYTETGDLFPTDVENETALLQGTSETQNIPEDSDIMENQLV